MLPGGLMSPQAVYFNAMRHPFLAHPGMIPGNNHHLPVDALPFKPGRLPSPPLPGKPLDLSPGNRSPGSPYSPVSPPPAAKRHFVDDVHSEQLLKSRTSSSSSEQRSDSVSPKMTSSHDASPAQSGLKFGITAILSGGVHDKHSPHKTGKLISSCVYLYVD